jgi:hypothetical protein
MTVIRDDDAERLARVEHMVETIKKRREDVAAVVQESEQVVAAAESALAGARTATARVGKTQKNADEAS